MFLKTSFTLFLTNKRLITPLLNLPINHNHTHTITCYVIQIIITSGWGKQNLVSNGN